MAKTPFLTLVVFIIGFGAGYFYYDDHLPKVFSSDSETPTLNVCFSPEGHCEKLALHVIQSAQKEILMQCYSFTSKPIADALIKAFQHGIHVRILFDKSQLTAPYSQIHRLKKYGIDVQLDSPQGLAHNKIIIVDSRKLISGSYNFSRSAHTRNAENMIFIQDKSFATIYKNKWHKRFQQNKK